MSTLKLSGLRTAVCNQTFLVALIFTLLITNRDFAFAEGGLADQDQQEKVGDMKSDVRIRASTFIRARPALVWSSIHEQRTGYSELEYAHVLSQDGPICITEQRFSVSLLGKTTCTFRETDHPPNEIDYELLKSDMFSAMDGKWVLSPTPNGRETRLDLYCHAGVRKPVPRFLLKLALSRSLKRHLIAIKKAAEKKQSN